MSTPFLLQKKNPDLEKITSVLTAFVYHAAKTAKAQGFNTIYFLTREGILLKKLYTRIKNSDPTLASLPDAKLLYISRLSSFLPSLKNASWERLQLLVEIKPDITIRGFLSSINIAPDIYQDLLKKYQISLDEKIKDNLEKMADFYNKYLKKKTENFHLNQREFFTTYLHANGIENNNSVFIIDIGWRGVSQDNIARLFPQCMVHGYYLGLFKYNIAQEKNVIKTGFLFDANHCQSDAVYSKKISVMPVEFLLSQNTGEVTHYFFNTREKIAPQIKSLTENEIKTSKYLRRFQEEILKQAPNHLNKKENVSSLKDALFNYIWQPNDELASIFFRYKNEQAFLHGKTFSPTDNTLKFTFLIKLILKKSARKNKKTLEALYHMGWPQAYFYLKYGVLYKKFIKKILLSIMIENQLH